MECKNLKFDGSIDNIISFKNDSHGKNIESTTRDANGTVTHVEKYSYMYDSDGKIVGMNGELLNKIQHLEYTDYELDDHGNYITRVAFYNRRPKMFILRNITYYGEEEKPLAERRSIDLQLGIIYPP